MGIKHILIVDDSRTEQHALTSLLEQAGYVVYAASNADEAMRKLSQALPDLILMDVVMPGTNGFALTRQISRDARYAQVPIFLCTSKGEETDRVWGLRQGARDYVTKPVDGPDLLAKIRALA